ncbi:hypothetical protein [Paenibacillus camerounensis]|uniref:hypothetical protein n=1 Tax=Paenibacillus camerounensis TaxID=1243663 RepID=UPI0005A680F0|nr:hypothetical protein [Paenibacillus camerounensis]
MEGDFYTNESRRKKLLEFLDRTFNYDGTTYLLAVSARISTEVGTVLNSHWKLRVALTYRENDNTINPYWDGTELEIAWAEDSIQLLSESALTDETPIIEGSPNALALEWIAEIAPPLWVSNEAKEAVAAEAGIMETRDDEHTKNLYAEDRFTEYFGK